MKRLRGMRQVRAGILSGVIATALLIGGSAVDLRAQGPFSAQIQAALRVFLAQAHTWTGVQTFTGVLRLPDGSVSTPAVGFINQPGQGLYRSGAGTLTYTSDGVANYASFTGSTFSLASGICLAWAPSANSTLAGDTFLCRDNFANVLGQRNSGSPQTFNIYNTYTDASNYERFTMQWSSGTMFLATQAAGTGSSRQMVFDGLSTLFRVGGTGMWLINTSGNIVDQGTHTLSLGGKISTYNNVATAGWGVPSIVAAGRVTAQTAAVASIATYTVGAADGSFEISANVRVTTSTTHNFSVTCAYTDESNVAQTATLNFQQTSSTINGAIANAAGAVPYMGLPIHIRAKAATAITIASTGTFTTVTYNAEGSIRQIS